MWTIPRTAIEPGRPAPDFSLPAADREGTVSLAEYHGRPVLLALFRGLYCPFCRHQIAQLVEQHAFVAVATWRPYVQVCRALDDVCHRLRRRWSVVEISGSALTCGPAIVPGSGAGCYHCFNARTDAHRRDGDRLRALRTAYAAMMMYGVPTSASGASAKTSA